MCSRSESAWTVCDFGVADYRTVHQRQVALAAERAEGRIGDTLLIGEHLPVITCGRNTPGTQLLTPVFPVIPVERGGGVTLHAPGQVVAYPIRALPEGQRDLHRVLRQLEQAVIEVLRPLGLTGERVGGLSGVWVRDPATGRLGKIAAVGVAVRRWVTYHGLALNVSNALGDYAQIRPCGQDADSVTSLYRLLGQEALSQEALSIDAVKQRLVLALTRSDALEGP